VRSSLVAVDANTGRGLRDVLALEDDSTGITSVLPSGVILNTLGTALTSGVAPLAGLADWLLPGELEPLLPVGGLQVSHPVGAADGASLDDRLAERLAQRNESDRARDATRRPLEVLRFAGIEEGQRLAELMAGEGFYAELLARAVGRSGRVVAHNNERSQARYGEQLALRLARIDAAEPARSGSSSDAHHSSSVAPIEARVIPLDALDLEAGSFDAIFLVQFYHDTVWMGVDRAEMNVRIFEALAPGGVFLVIDHATGPGVGSDEVKTLHRIEREQVEREVQAAGFRLAERSSLLENPLDDHTRNVFDPEIRGRTDRFLLRFEKPASRD
jgi:predicted methyltransferase